MYPWIIYWEEQKKDKDLFVHKITHRSFLVPFLLFKLSLHTKMVQGFVLEFCKTSDWFYMLCFAKFFGHRSKTAHRVTFGVLVQRHFPCGKDISLPAWKVSFSIFEWNMRTPSHNARAVGQYSKQPIHKQKRYFCPSLIRFRTPTEHEINEEVEIILIDKLEFVSFPHYPFYWL